MLELARDRDSLDMNATTTVMIGDKVESDIVVAKNVGISSILVCTGVDSQSTIARHPIQPDYVIQTLETLYNLIK
jgi:ribonucleotide monophosphatase NagD (HAD superfamily)